MNWDKIRGNWRQIKGKALEEWGKLTADELDRVNGERERLIGQVQERYGIAKEMAEEQVQQWADRI